MSIGAQTAASIGAGVFATIFKNLIQEPSSQ